MNKWEGKKILIIGAARQGLALARYLHRKGADVTLNDIRTPDQLENTRKSLADINIHWVLGGHPEELIEAVDLICPSGGVSLDLPIIKQARHMGITLSNDSQIFLDTVQCPVIGITGSAGKTTTTTLVGRIANASADGKRKVWVGGNIGYPLINNVDEISPQDIVIMELSSFQLEVMTTSPEISAVLNITPNHLDRHGNMNSYKEAKYHILAYQHDNDIAVLGRDDPGAWDLATRVKGHLLSFGINPPQGQQNGTFLSEGYLYLQDNGQRIKLMPESIIQLRGEHNRLNILAACSIAHAAGFSPEAMAAGVNDFHGVPHRLELVRTWKGVDWYNDSIATAPERTMAAIESFDEPMVLLLGGRDKDLPWENLASLIHQRVDHVIIFGEAAPKIMAAIGKQEENIRPFTIEEYTTLKDAIEAAARIAGPGSIVLLSPGGTSFDEFRDFEERGEEFRKWVQLLS